MNIFVLKIKINLRKMKKKVSMGIEIEMWIRTNNKSSWKACFGGRKRTKMKTNLIEKIIKFIHLNTTKFIYASLLNKRTP